MKIIYCDKIDFFNKSYFYKSGDYQIFKTLLKKQNKGKK